MNRLVRLIWRMVVVVTAYIAAIYAAGLFLVIGVAGPDISDSGIGSLDMSVRVAFLAMMIGGYVGVFTFIPAGIMIVLAEWRGWRGFLTYSLFGLALGVFIFALVGNHGISGAPGPVHYIGAAGAFAGSVYWMIAGRNAGKLFDQMVNLSGSK
jgi:hypothetical protein